MENGERGGGGNIFFQFFFFFSLRNKHKYALKMKKCIQIGQTHPPL